jgi:hypothetical protein
VPQRRHSVAQGRGAVPGLERLRQEQLRNPPGKKGQLWGYYLTGLFISWIRSIRDERSDMGPNLMLLNSSISIQNETMSMLYQTWLKRHACISDWLRRRLRRPSLLVVLSRRGHQVQVVDGAEGGQAPMGRLSRENQDILHREAYRSR